MQIKSRLSSLLVSLAFISVSTFATGCASIENLPLVNAEKIEYARAGIYSSASISAINVVVTETEVTAESLDATVSYPIVGSVTIKVTKYRRERKP